eukprot:6184612-Pleurochrysis_carterae.AAC.1
MPIAISEGRPVHAAAQTSAKEAKRFSANVRFQIQCHSTKRQARAIYLDFNKARSMSTKIICAHTPHTPLWKALLSNRRPTCSANLNELNPPAPSRSRTTAPPKEACYP